MQTPFRTYPAIILSTLFFITIMGCHNGPKVMEPVSLEHPDKEANPWILQDPSAGASENTQSFREGLHRVKILEVLPTQRYVYLRVQEEQDTYWIATRKTEVAIGDFYFYRNGLLKTNFESKEYKKMFDEIYLVSNLVAEDHSKHVAQQNSFDQNRPEAFEIPENEATPPQTLQSHIHEGVVRISDLVKNPKAYEGHTILLKGTCFKINPNIMERNWIHLRDGSQDDFDLVITSDSFVPEGTEITIKGTVALDQDFGAGYTYDIILENGMIVQ